MVNRERARARYKQTNKKKQRRRISYVDLARAKSEALVNLYFTQTKCKTV